MLRLVFFIALFLLFVVYSATVYTIGTEKNNYASQEALAGKVVFQQKNCIACHQIYGLGGYLGSDLTHALSDPAKGELYARALLRSGSERMPDFRLTNHEIDVIMEYLRYVDQTERQIIK